jgi:hypothetical protein
VEAIATYGDGTHVLSFGGEAARWWDVAQGVDHGRTLPITGDMWPVTAGVSC